MKRHIIHVNQHVIKRNRTNTSHELEPVLTVKGEGKNQYGYTAEIWFRGELVGEFVYRPHDPLSCGAHVWFQTEADDEIEVRVS